jgi:hypothetical protein
MQPVISFGLAAVYIGLYSGIIAGILADNISNIVLYFISGILSLCAYIPLSFACEFDGTSAHVGILGLFAIAGFAGSLGVMTSIITLAKNFGSGKASILIVTIAMTYFKIAYIMDDAFHTGFLGDFSLSNYFLLVGLIMFVVLNAAALSIYQIDV